MSPLFAMIPPPPTSGIELGPLNVRFYGLLIALGAYLALRLMVRRYDRFGGDPQHAETAALVMLGAGLIGARIGYVIPRLDYFLARPQEIIAIWQGGLTLFGGLFGGIAGALVYARRKAMDLRWLFDAVAPAMPLAQAIGRWGNYFNQELYGRPTDLPWALQVEAPFRRPGFEQFSTFHPTFLYESIWNLLLVVVLLRIDRTGRLRRGALAFVYLIGYGIGRAWIETLRVDTAERYLGLSRNNWVALLVIAVGIAGLVWWQRRAQPAAVEAPENGQPDAADTPERATNVPGDSVDRDETDRASGAAGEDRDENDADTRGDGRQDEEPR